MRRPSEVPSPADPAAGARDQFGPSEDNWRLALEALNARLDPLGRLEPPVPLREQAPGDRIALTWHWRLPSGECLALGTATCRTGDAPEEPGPALTLAPCEGPLARPLPELKLDRLTLGLSGPAGEHLWGRIALAWPAAAPVLRCDLMLRERETPSGWLSVAVTASTDRASTDRASPSDGSAANRFRGHLSWRGPAPAALLDRLPALAAGWAVMKDTDALLGLLQDGLQPVLPAGLALRFGLRWPEGPVGGSGWLAFRLSGAPGAALGMVAALRLRVKPSSGTVFPQAPDQAGLPGGLAGSLAAGLLAELSALAGSEGVAGCGTGLDYRLRLDRAGKMTARGGFAP